MRGISPTARAVASVVVTCAAVRGQNYPLVMMLALIIVSMTLLASFLVDILTALLDPRVRLE
jgi:ABC-type dipeptide/oligopeptide/nickel transport system permease component